MTELVVQAFDMPPNQTDKDIGGSQHFFVSWLTLAGVMRNSVTYMNGIGCIGKSLWSKRFPADANQRTKPWLVDGFR